MEDGNDTGVNEPSCSSSSPPPAAPSKLQRRREYILESLSRFSVKSYDKGSQIKKRMKEKIDNIDKDELKLKAKVVGFAGRHFMLNLSVNIASLVIAFAGVYLTILVFIDLNDVQGVVSMLGTAPSRGNFKSRMCYVPNKLPGPNVPVLDPSPSSTFTNCPGGVGCYDWYVHPMSNKTFSAQAFGSCGNTAFCSVLFSETSSEFDEAVSNVQASWDFLYRVLIIGVVMELAGIVIAIVLVLYDLVMYLTLVRTIRRTMRLLQEFKNEEGKAGNVYKPKTSCCRKCAHKLHVLLDIGSGVAYIVVSVFMYLQPNVLDTFSTLLAKQCWDSTLMISLAGNEATLKQLRDQQWVIGLLIIGNILVPQLNDKVSKLDDEYRELAKAISSRDRGLSSIVEDEGSGASGGGEENLFAFGDPDLDEIELPELPPKPSLVSTSAEQNVALI